MQLTPCTTPSLEGTSLAKKRMSLFRREAMKMSPPGLTVAAPIRVSLFMATFPPAPGALLALKPDIIRTVPLPSLPRRKTPSSG